MVIILFPAFKWMVVAFGAHHADAEKDLGECLRTNLRIAQGWQFLAIGSELRFMTAEAQRLAKGLNLKKSADLARY